MNIYGIEVLAIGEYVAIDQYDKSGCSDLFFDCWQEAAFLVAANSIEEAVSLIYQQYDNLNNDYINSCDTICYNPVPISENEDDGDISDILDYHFYEPKKGNWKTDAPAKYSKVFNG